MASQLSYPLRKADWDFRGPRLESPQNGVAVVDLPGGFRPVFAPADGRVTQVGRIKHPVRAVTFIHRHPFQGQEFGTVVILHSDLTESILFPVDLLPAPRDLSEGERVTKGQQIGSAAGFLVWQRWNTIDDAPIDPIANATDARAEFPDPAAGLPKAKVTEVEPAKGGGGAVAGLILAAGVYFLTKRGR